MTNAARQEALVGPAVPQAHRLEFVPRSTLAVWRPRTDIAAIAVVVPARNEAERLPACLAALSEASRRTSLPVHVVVALDHCIDGTGAALADVPDVHAIRVPRSSAGGVGQARRVGVHAALKRLGAVSTSQVWLASTDADSQVPVDWLDHQVRLADAGADLVLGTVALDVDHSAWHTWYAERIAADGSHDHVHGANLGIRASTYLAAGGWPAIRAHEDVHLARAVSELSGAQVLSTSAQPVVTSARLSARAPGGLAADLRRLEQRSAVPPSLGSLCG